MTHEQVKELEARIASLPDSVEKVDAINQLSFSIRNTDPSRSFLCCKQAKELSEALNYRKGYATALTQEAFASLQTASYELALEKLLEALNLFELLQDKAGIAKVHYNFCLIYMRLSDFDNALDSINKSLDYYIEENNLAELVRCYFQLGSLSRALNDTAGAIEYHNQGLALSMKIGDRAGEAAALMGLGNVYLMTREYDQSEECLAKSSVIQQQINDSAGYAASLSTHVSLCLETENYSQAERSIQTGLELVKRLGIRNGECRFLLDQGRAAFRQGDTVLAERKAFEALEIADKLSLRTLSAPAHLLLSEIYHQKRDFENALQHHRLFFQVNDEDAKTNAALKARSIQFVNKIENAQREAEINRLKNVELKNALSELEEKNREITASITYALRIQTAILPPHKIVKQHLEQSFILYKPKDIVAGDFYWMETVGDLVLFAACDCTGHGVPGAMISLVCHNALNRAVREFGLTKPAAILDKTAEIVIENFSKSEEEISDGMDISLCAFDPVRKTLAWAGANNPLWLVRNGVLVETKGDKQCIGMNDQHRPFTNHVVAMEAGDAIYIFTDGFADQFGGESGKKLTRKRFADLIISLQDRSMEEQGRSLDDFISVYRSEIMQVDDILVIGVRV